MARFATIVLRQFLRQSDVGLCTRQKYPANVSQFFSFDTPNAPSKRTSRFTRSGNYEATAESRHSPGTPLSV
jgi:hypothetical protein